MNFGMIKPATVFTRYHVSTYCRPHAWILLLSLLVCLQSQAAQCFPGILRAWWPGDGTGYDIRGANHLLLKNGATFAPGKVGQAFSLDGVDDYLEAARSSNVVRSAEGFSLELWVNFSSVRKGTLDQPGAVFMSQTEGSVLKKQWAFAFGDGKLFFHTTSPASGPRNIALADFNPSPNQWYHLVVTLDGASVYRIYVNGLLLSNETNTDPIPEINAPLLVGQSEGSGYFHGLLDEVSIHSNVLLPDAVQRLYAADSAGKCRDCTFPPAGLVGWWTGDGNSLDIQGTNSGQLNGGAEYVRGEAGEAFAFDGFTGHVSTPLDVMPAAMPSATWMAWVYPTRINAGRQQILSTDDGGYDRSLLIEWDRWAVFTGYGSWVCPGPQPFLNAWQHVAVTYSPTNMEFHLQGGHFTVGTPGFGSSGYRLQIGRNPGFGEYFQGYIDEVMIFDRALTHEEIEAIFNADHNGLCRPAISAPRLELSPSSLDFGQVKTNSARDLSFLIRNTGGAPLTGSFAISNSQYSVITPASLNVPPGLQQMVTVRFAPLTIGTQAGILTLKHNDALHPDLAIPLTGDGKPDVDCVAFPSGLVSWWRAEDYSAEDSFATNHGILRNEVQFVPGKVGQGFKFDGINDYVEAPTEGLTVGTGDFTVEGWAKTSSAKGFSCLWSFGPYQPGFYIRYFGGISIYYGGHVGTITPTNVVYNDGKFHHFAFTRQNAVLSCYGDGQLLGTFSFGYSLDRSPFLIGGDTDGSDYFDGIIDEVSFYKRSLAAAEIAAIFNAGDAGKCAHTTRPRIHLAAANVDFGNVMAGVTKELPLTISNTGTGPLTINATATDNNVFGVTTPSVPFSIAPGSNQTITVRFTPVTVGAQSGNLVIASDDSLLPAVSVTLAGTGTETTNCVTTPAGLVSWWTGDGAATDRSGTNHGVLKNGAGIGTGKVGQGFTLDGINDYVEVTTGGLNVGTGDFTLEGWAKTSSKKEFLALFSFGAYEPGFYIRSSGAATIYFGNHRGTVTPTNLVFNDGQFHHFAFARQSGNVSVYGDGRLIGTIPLADAIVRSPALIGGDMDGNDYFDGVLDEISFYNRPLTAAEIISIYNAGSNGKCPATDQPKISLSTANLDFGNVTAGESKTANLTVTNSGAATLTVSSISFDKSVFSVTSPTIPFSLSPGATQTIAIRFAPGSTGAQTGIATIINNDLATPSVTVGLKGTGTAGPPEPVITLIDPASGTPGTVIAIGGTNFSSIATDNFVNFNAIAASVINSSDSQIIAVVPSGLPSGTANVSVTVASKTSPGAAFTVASASTGMLKATPLGNEVLLSWPSSATTFQLESTTSLTPPVSWQPFGGTPTVAGDQFNLRLSPAASSTRFFRLHANLTTAQSGSAVITPAGGGIVTLPDSDVQLMVPPGAVDTNTTIKVELVSHTATDSSVYASEVIFSPNGLTFKQPATLLMKIPPGLNTSADLQVYSLSEQNGPLRSGGEQTYLLAVTNFTYDSTSGMLQVPVAHFSLLHVLGQRFNQEIVFDIPGKYLKRSDMIYVLTRDPVPGAHGLGWVPGHVGMYLGTTDVMSNENDGKTIIESTSADETPDKKYGGYVDGVQVRTDFDLETSAFKKMAGNHLYMGARRPRPEPTEAERNGAAAWALGRQNTPYAHLGGTFIFSGDDGLSCVGLTEKAYESVGINIVPGYFETPLMPIRQFLFTDQVTEITIEAGTAYLMSVYGVVSAGFGNYSEAPFPNYQIKVTAAEGSPAEQSLNSGRAVWNGNFFTFKPNEDDADLSHVFRFTLDGSASGNKSRTIAFAIHVKSKETSEIFVRQDPPVIQIESQFYSGDLVVTNTGAYVTGASGRLGFVWAEPPEQLITGQSVQLTLTPDPTTSLSVYGRSFGSPAVPRRLYGDIDFFVNDSSDGSAMIGYLHTDKKCETSDCYELAQRPVTRTRTIGTEEFTVTINLAAYGGLTFGGNGERKASVRWTYVKK